MTPESSTPPEGISILYDGDCPFCAAFVRMARFRAAAGPVRLINARGSDPLIARARAAGLDLDTGMVVVMDGRMVHGDRAMALLASLSTPSGAFNAAMRWAFRSEARARLIYPVLVAGRAVTLRLLGRTKIGAGP